MGVWLALAALATSGGEAAPGPTVDFARDVRPILSDKCFKCHGTDEASREADLRLDSPEGAYAERPGGRAVDPDEPAASLLLARVASTDEDERMPPPGSGLEVSPAQVDLLRRWIESGGRYEEHWAFRPIARPAPPSEPPTERGWARGPADAFVQARLAAAGLTPSPQAERSTLLRRVHLDLLGLPPETREIAAFESNETPDAYERIVDRALASPAFGERWGRHWLDQARYADTNGYTVDSERSIWPYRDWVIAAFNADLPFDRFTIEQLAGDLLPDAGVDALVATGFHRNSLVNEEGGTDNEQFRNEATVDRVNTTGAVWLGLTVGCAQCHSHKYDPLTQHEYYRLFAFFNQAQDVNAVAPTTLVPTEAEKVRLAELDAAAAQAKRALAEYDARRRGEGSSEDQDDGEPAAWAAIEECEAASAAGASFERLAEGVLLAGGTNGESDVYTIRFRPSTPLITAVRIEALTHASLPKMGPGRAGNGNFVLVEVELTVGESRAEWIGASADLSQKNYDVSQAIDGDSATGWAIKGPDGTINANRTARFFCKPLEAGEGAEAVLTLRFGSKPPHYNLGSFRLSTTDAPHAKLDLPDPERAALESAHKRAAEARENFAKSIATTMVMRENSTPRASHVLIRGDFLRRGDAVEPEGPAFLPAMQDSSERRTRLHLARWLVEERNPLPPRVTVNRVWMRLFGEGLVETENDFGYQGTPPTHPELLDWLAWEFSREGWSLKRTIREIAGSATYRQASARRAEGERIDPINKLLWRQTRLRVEAEIVRDLALSAGGLIERRIGGPSVRPPQPEGVYAFTQREAKWPTSEGGDRYRRGMYTFFMRSAPHPMLTTFDVPAMQTTCTRRVRSNTALQSLAVANDESMFESARGLGRRLVEAGGGDGERAELAYRICLARTPTEPERARLVEYVERERAFFDASPEEAEAVSGVAGPPAPESAAWTMAGRVLMNLDEFITRE